MKHKPLSSKGFTIGIDLGGTKMLTVLLDKKNRVRAEVKVKTRVDKGKKYFIDAILESVREVLRDGRVTLKEIKALGIGCPGIIDVRTGTVAYSPNIPFLKNFSLGGSIKKALGVTVALENDVNAGLYGEYCFGAAKKACHAVGIFLGTGIGGALIFDGKLYRGATGAAGEVGHMAMASDGPLCGCGKQGCFEALASRSSVAAEAALLAGRQQAPHLFDEAGTDLAKIKSGLLAKALKEGDSAIKDLIVRKSTTVGRMMANLVNLLSPDTIVLGGGLVEAMPERIVKAASEAMHEFAMPQLAAHVQVLPAELGDYAIVMGAAELAREKRRVRA